MKLKVLLIVMLVVVGGAALFVSLGGFAANAAGQTRFLTSAAAIGDVTADIAASGSIESTGTYGLAFGRVPRLIRDGASEASGNGSSTTWPVTEVNVEVGDSVKAGDVLAAADTSRLEQDLRIAAIDLNTARIQYTIASEAFEEADDTDSWRQAKVSLSNADIGRTKARQVLEDLEAELEHASLVSLVDGVVTTVSIAPGAAAPSGDAITLAATEFQVTANVVEGDLPTIALGQTATISVDSLDVNARATVVAIAPVAGGGDGSVVTFPVTIRLAEVPDGVRAGMTADVTITTGSASNVLVVPTAALAGSGGEYTVRVIGTAGEVETRAVTVGLVTDSLAEIRDGLAEGDLVVTGTTADRQSTTTDTVPGRGTFPGAGGGLGGGLGGFRP